MDMQTIGSPALWGGFGVFVLGMLAIDLGVFHRKPHAVSFKEALGWSVVWVLLSGLFALAVGFAFGPTPGLEFATGYLIEKALAVDNIFVFVLLFSFFRVKPEHQHGVLFWGILGALLMRGLFIGLGAALIHQFHWVIYVFGALLIATAIKLFVSKEGHMDPESNFVYRLVRRFVPSTEDYRGASFFVKENGRWLATPLLTVLVLVEATDLLFAVDSIPAIFAVTKDPFIVFTSNIFAILGLRSMYFLLAGVVHRFHYLKPALSLILAFVGSKMLLGSVFVIPTLVSLGVIGLILAAAIALSVAWPKPVVETDVPHVR